ncbi:MAG: PAS domain-containing protein [Kiloniellaceae bacterium]
MADVLFNPEPQSIEHPGLRALHDYWVSRRDGGLLPGRQHLDPLDIPGLLPNLTLIDVVAAAALRYRLVGTALVGRIGRDITGRLVKEASLGPGWEENHPDFRYVIGERRPCLRRIWTGGARRNPLESLRLLLPLAADGEAVDMILGGVFWPDDG